MQLALISPLHDCFLLVAGASDDLFLFLLIVPDSFQCVACPFSVPVGSHIGGVRLFAFIHIFNFPIVCYWVFFVIVPWLVVEFLGSGKQRIRYLSSSVIQSLHK